MNLARRQFATEKAVSLRDYLVNVAHEPARCAQHPESYRDGKSLRNDCDVCIPRITPGLSMVASLASLISGAALVSLAERHPGYIAALEFGAGVLLIGGLALLGATLPFLP